jgi:hypothetical protein
MGGLNDKLADLLPTRGHSGCGRPALWQRFHANMLSADFTGLNHKGLP